MQIVSKKDLIFHANCLQWILFSGKNKKNVFNLSSAEVAQRVENVKYYKKVKCIYDA